MGLSNGEERRREARRKEDRRKEDRRKKDREGEDRRKEDRRREGRRKEDKIKRKRRRRRTLLWLLIIVFVSLLFSVLIGGTIDVISKKWFTFKDDSYRPMDLDRIRNELEKAKSAGKN